MTSYNVNFRADLLLAFYPERVCFRRLGQWKPIFSTRIRKWIFKTALRTSVRKLLIDGILQCVLYKADVDPFTILIGKNIRARKTNKTLYRRFRNWKIYTELLSTVWRRMLTFNDEPGLLSFHFLREYSSKLSFIYTNKRKYFSIQIKKRNYTSVRHYRTTTW